jgi:uncharacterized protein (TIGR02145 family)
MRKLLLSAAFIAASFTSIAQVGIGTNKPDASAVLELESTTKGFLPPRMTLAQINVIVTPAEGLMVYCLDCTTKGLLVNNGLEFISIINGESLDKVAVAAIVADADNPADGTPSLVALTTLGLTNVTAAAQEAYEIAIADAVTVPTTLAELQVIIDAVNKVAVAAIVASADNPADGTPSLANLTDLSLTNVTAAPEAYEIAIAVAEPVPTTLAELQVIIDAVNKTDTITTVEDLISATGKTWMNRNLGATQVATSVTDEDSYGDLYQWGRPKDGHESRNSNTTDNTVISASAGHGDFILATSATDNNWTDFIGEDTLWQSGLNDPCPTGYRIPTEPELEAEIDEFEYKNDAGAFSALKLPLAGNRSSSLGSVNNVGTGGRYWSSTVGVSLSSTKARRLTFLSSNASVSNSDRANGYSVRCIKYL